ncbi:hypothetical protein ABZW47_31460 [Streptomyces sp. NPDC004549]|uniref:hypothetical protein n=1 Tax=Streptomyces sp. NPDC004549 TaxID=3154283 RepID=UPI0033A3F7FB
MELSGLALVELLDVSARSARWWSGEDPSGRALCQVVYRAAAAVVDELDAAPARDAVLPPITVAEGVRP